MTHRSDRMRNYVFVAQFFAGVALIPNPSSSSASRISTVETRVDRSERNGQHDGTAAGQLKNSICRQLLAFFGIPCPSRSLWTTTILENSILAFVLFAGVAPELEGTLKDLSQNLNVNRGLKNQSIIGAYCKSQYKNWFKGTHSCRCRILRNIFRVPLTTPSSITQLLKRKERVWIPRLPVLHVYKNFSQNFPTRCSYSKVRTSFARFSLTTTAHEHMEPFNSTPRTLQERAPIHDPPLCKAAVAVPSCPFKTHELR